MALLAVMLSNSRLSLKPRSSLCFTSITTTTPHQNLSEGGVLEV